MLASRVALTGIIAGLVLTGDRHDRALARGGGRRHWVILAALVLLPPSDRSAHRAEQGRDGDPRPCCSARSISPRRRGSSAPG